MIWKAVAIRASELFLLALIVVAVAACLTVGGLVLSSYVQATPECWCKGREEEVIRNGTTAIVLIVIASVLAAVVSVMLGWGSRSVVHVAPRGCMDLVSVDGLPSGTYYTVIRDAVTNKEYLVVPRKQCHRRLPDGRRAPAEKGQPE